MPQSKQEERRLYRMRHPEKIREQRRKYLDRRIKKAIILNPELKIKMEKKLLHDFDRLTKLSFEDNLPKHCERCGKTSNLHIHHLQYIFPIELKHLVRLCINCHKLEHHRLNPSLNREEFNTHPSN